MVHRNALCNSCGMERRWTGNSSMSLSNRLTQLCVSSVTVSRCYFFRKKRIQKKKNRETNGLKIADGRHFLSSPPPAKENWSGNAIAGATHELKRVNPLRLLLGHVKHTISMLTKTSRGADTCCGYVAIHAHVKNHRDFHKRDRPWYLLLRCFSFAPYMW